FNDASNTTINLEVTAPGDFNHDGSVDAADYVVWRKNGGSSADYDNWRAHFGQTYTPGGGATSAAVPEPTGCILLCLGGLMALRKRVRQRCDGCVYASPRLCRGCRPRLQSTLDIASRRNGVFEAAP